LKSTISDLKEKVFSRTNPSARKPTNFIQKAKEARERDKINLTP